MGVEERIVLPQRRWQDLPPPALQEVGGSLELDDFASARLACKSWAQLLVAGARYVIIKPHRLADITSSHISALLACLSPGTTITLSWTGAKQPSASLLQAFLSAISSAKLIKDLELVMPISWHEKNLLAPLQHSLQHFTHLTSFQLQIGSYQLSKQHDTTSSLTTTILTNLTNLQTLNLPTTTIPNPTHLSALQALKHLSFATHTKPQATMDILSNLQHLQSLKCTFFQDRKPKANPPPLKLPDLQHLTSLKLSYTSGVTTPSTYINPPPLQLSPHQCSTLQELHPGGPLQLPSSCHQLEAMRKLTVPVSLSLPLMPQLTQLDHTATSSSQLLQALQQCPQLQALTMTLPLADAHSTLQPLPHLLPHLTALTANLHIQQDATTEPQQFHAALAALTNLVALHLDITPGAALRDQPGFSPRSKQLAALRRLRCYSGPLLSLDVADLPAHLTNLQPVFLQQVVDSGQQQGAGSRQLAQLAQLHFLQRSAQHAIITAALHALRPCLGSLECLSCSFGMQQQGADADASAAQQQEQQLYSSIAALTSLQELQLTAPAAGLQQHLQQLGRLTSLEFEQVGSKSSQWLVVEAVSGLSQLRRLEARPCFVGWRSKALRRLLQALPRCDLIVDAQYALQQML